MKTILPLALVTGLLALSGLAPAAPIVWGVNDHGYDLVTTATPTTYAAAKAAAEASSFRGVAGRLLILDTADYANELDFVRTNVVRPNAANSSAFYIGVTRPNGTGPTTDNWTWDDGTSVPTSITSGWNIDYFEGNVPYAGIFYQADNFTTVWDYAAANPTNLTGGYVVEYAAPVPEPASMAALGLGALALLKRRKRA